MKLTESRIKQIIQEEISNLSEEESLPEETAIQAEEAISKIADENERLIVQNYIMMLKTKAGMK